MLQITISEYGYIGCDNISTINDKFVGNRDLTPTLFQELYDFWLSDEESQKVLTFVNKKCLKAKNYVGVIQTANITIEILPKIYDGQKEEESRDIFIKMLKPLLNINEIQLNRADLSTTKNRNIYEIFITMFIEYVDKLIHKGIKSQYLEKEENQHFLKGKLQFNQHIKKNYIHKERFYVQFDEYLPNRAENRVIKSTISLLLTKTRDHNNQKNLRQQLFIFDEVNLSTNYETDIKRVNLHRGMEYYDMPIRFAKLFLTHHSFSSLRGKENVFALLFPMQTVFEKYMEFVLENSKEKLGIQQVLINGGRDEYFLSNGACKMTNLNPDYLLKMKSGKDIITDAKWKILEEKDDTNKKCNKVSITSNDVYQIFAYLNFYDCRDTAYLFVPKIENEIVLNYNMTNKKIKIIPIDLINLVKNHKAQKEWFVDGHNEVL
jgi:5-methylcytosine-specific restriction enzyme subunit McrC